jgi:signal transduction histidine kinase
VAVVVNEGCNWIEVEVRDTGEGIAPEDLSLIWERFYRGSEGSQNPQGGAGLGLALVKELTEAMGGSVDVESTLGEGSVFTIRLPKANLQESP